MNCSRKKTLFKRIRLFLPATLLSGIPFLAAVSSQAAQSVTLAWNPSSGPYLAGYRVHEGTVSGTYTKTIDVGNSTTATISGLTAGVTYYFVVTAYNTTGVESTHSNQISCTGTGAVSLFSANDTPGTADWNDPNPVELGVQFQSSVAGTVTAIRFYKGPLNTGTHVGNLWSASGTLLATATFSNETSSGWQQVNFSSPVPITANTIYVASYHNGGEYAADHNYFNTAHTNGPLTAPATGHVADGNGVYVYGSTSAFPTNTNLASNFWVDVVFGP